MLYVVALCSFTTLMVYKIPMEDVKSLAHSFSKLENGEFVKKKKIKML